MAQLVASMSGVVLGCQAVLSRSWVRISLEAKYLQHLSAQLIHYIPLYIYILYETLTIGDMNMKRNHMTQLMLSNESHVVIQYMV